MKNDSKKKQRGLKLVREIRKDLNKLYGESFTEDALINTWAGSIEASLNLIRKRIIEKPDER